MIGLEKSFGMMYSNLCINSRETVPLSEENINFSKLYMQNFLREFANSIVNPASGEFWNTCRVSMNICWIVFSWKTLIHHAYCIYSSIHHNGNTTSSLRLKFPLWIPPQTKASATATHSINDSSEEDAATCQGCFFHFALDYIRPIKMNKLYITMVLRQLHTVKLIQYRYTYGRKSCP